jgi:hypothetical protein
MKNSNIQIIQESQPENGSWLKYAQSSISVDDLFSRTPFSEEAISGLKNARVGVVGLGSGGGKIALDLAKAGVGKFVLLDPDRLKPHNVPRHIADLRDIGRYKVDAVSDRMLYSNPCIQVQGYPRDCFSPQSELSPASLFADCDLIIAATDRTEIQLAINAVTWRGKIPALFGGCYESARGGEIFFTLPEAQLPCLACLRGGLALPERSHPFDYSNANRVQDYQGEPGLNAAVDWITNLETQIALAILLRRTSSPLAQILPPGMNFLLVGGALGSGYYRFKRPFHIYWQPLAGPRPDCEVCQAGDQELIIKLDELDCGFDFP